MDKLSPSFICPLTQEVMKDPVIDHEGNSYERQAIEHWLQTNQTSPITRNPLFSHQLSPNRALKEVIDLHLKVTNISLAGPPAVPSSSSSSSAASSSSKPVNPAEKGVTLEAKAVKLDSGIYLLASVVPPVGEERTPSDICCIIDTSGSMDDEASVKNDSGVTESHGLSLLDIVKHAVATVIETMLPQDRLCLVSFSQSAKVVLKLTQMNDEGKQKAHQELNRMHASGSTNFWDGLNTGLELLRNNISHGRLANLLILTDGCPTVSPPKGELEAMKKYKEEHKNDFPCAVTTFGFGYSVNSDLLKQIAILGDGMYSFIPDSSLVGTVFVNSISNLLCSFGKNAKLSIEGANGTKIEKVIGGFSSFQEGGAEVLLLSSLQYDQKKDVLMKIVPAKNKPPHVIISLKFDHFKHDKPVEQRVEVTEISESPDYVNYVHCRFTLIDALREIITKMNGAKPSAQAKLAALIKELEKSTDPRVAPLLADATGQISEAISKDEWWQRWGRHFLPSLMGAHLLQQCNNFKDPGIQSYGGPLFEKIRDEVEIIFNKLPPPKPSRPIRDNSAPLTNMNAYYNYGGGCFHGNSSVWMADNSQQLVKNIKKGDKILSPNGKSAEILCVLKMLCPTGTTSLVELAGGLLITAYHPVRINQKWTFPCNIKPAQMLPCDAVYTFVLNKESEHVLLIDGIECVSLGHNKQEEVVRHAFLGTDAVVNEMRKMKGWEGGLIVLPNAAQCFARDSKTHMVCGFHEIGRVANLGA